MKEKGSLSTGLPFLERNTMESQPMKNGKGDIFDRLMRLPVLRIFYPFYEKHKMGLLYLFFGALTTLVDLAVSALCVYLLGIDEIVSTFLAWVAAVAFAYITNRIWVFASSARGARAISLEALKFAGGRIGTFLLSEASVTVFVTWLGFDYMAVRVISSVAVVILNFVLGKWFVFRKSRKNEE